ncbi:MAG: L-threonine dehydratase catabolic TdcB, partial [Verrucomicrobiota bacterium]
RRPARFRDLLACALLLHGGIAMMLSIPYWTAPLSYLPVMLSGRTERDGALVDRLRSAPAGLRLGLLLGALAMLAAIPLLGQATEPAAADDSARSFRAGQRLPVVAPKTIADGLRTSIGEPNFEIARRCVDDVVTVSEAGIIAAMRLIWDAVKIVVEPSAAVPYAAIMEGRVDVAGLRVGIILSGGNVDLDQLPWTAQPPAA